MNSLSKTLKRIISFPDLHGRWLNTASYLEYVGARKILKAFPERKIESELLAHALEEISHATLLKKAANAVSGKNLDYEFENLLAGPASKAYIQTLDQQTAQTLGFSNKGFYYSVSCYLYTTLLIEARAIEVYSLYAQLLPSSPALQAMKTILGQENRHLTEVKQRLLETDDRFNSIYERLKTVESKLFSALWNELEAEVCLDCPSHFQEISH